MGPSSSGGCAGGAWYLVLGWRFGLGLRLGPQRSPSHVLGWKIVRSTPHAIILEVQSLLLTAHNVVQVQDAGVLLTTFVRYERARRRPPSGRSPPHCTGEQSPIS